MQLFALLSLRLGQAAKQRALSGVVGGACRARAEDGGGRGFPGRASCRTPLDRVARARPVYSAVAVKVTGRSKLGAGLLEEAATHPRHAGR